MRQPRLLVASLLITVLALAVPRLVWARTPSITPDQISTPGSVLAIQATDSATATEAGETATSAAAAVVQEVTERKPNVTEPGGEIAGQLEQYVINQPQTALSGFNFLQHAIRTAVMSGVPANTIVLVILFPLVAALIAAGRHLVGLRGFGIFTPAVLSVAFVATGIITGILLFLIILGMATLGKNVLKKAKLQYLPRMAFLLWFVCLGVLAVLLIAPVLGLENLMKLSIFPILILVLLAETFIEVQIGKSRREAMELTVETIILALISSLVLSLEMVQRFALIHPELLLIMVALFDVFMGKYVGLRYTEYRKFKKLLK